MPHKAKDNVNIRWKIICAVEAVLLLVLFWGARSVLEEQELALVELETRLQAVEEDATILGEALLEKGTKLDVVSALSRLGFDFEEDDSNEIRLNVFSIEYKDNGKLDKIAPNDPTTSAPASSQPEKSELETD